MATQEGLAVTSKDDNQNANPVLDPMHQDGIAHLKSTQTPAIPTPQPPASNPGAEDPSAGIPANAGGLSSASHVHSPVPSSSDSSAGGIGGGVVGTVKSFLGFGSGAGEEKKAEELESPAGVKEGAERDSEDEGSDGKGVGALVAGAGAGAAAAGVAAKGDGAADPVASVSGEKAQDGGDASAAPAGGDVSAGDKDKPLPAEPESKADSAPPPTNKAGGQSGYVENKQGIPTAGGEKLGALHAGESKVVPDNPAPRAGEEKEKGVSSKEGQPTGKISLPSPEKGDELLTVCVCVAEQTKTNTAANTGGATGGPGAGAKDETSSTGSPNGGKQKLSEKLKEKLHIGSKKS